MPSRDQGRAVTYNDPSPATVEVDVRKRTVNRHDSAPESANIDVRKRTVNRQDYLTSQRQSLSVSGDSTKRFSHSQLDYVDEYILCTKAIIITIFIYHFHLSFSFLFCFQRLSYVYLVTFI
jgi:hypothetical protein